MKRKGPIVLVMGVLVILLAYLMAADHELTVSRYVVETPLGAAVRIVQLTDLHNAEFGDGNCELIALVEAQDPDLIVMTGDMLNRDEPGAEVVTELVTSLVEIAPVYYGYGNHETDWESDWDGDLRPALEDAGAVVLDNEYADIEVNGCPIRLGGYMAYYGQPHMMTNDPQQQKLERAFYAAFEDTDRYKILLNHIPTQWVDWEYVNKHPVDLIFSGHYHGGIIRIPIWDRGLFAPYVGWFPPCTKGVYAGTEGTCILSAGLGSEYPLPRLNNPPEIVVADLIPAGDHTGGSL